MTDLEKSFDNVLLGPDSLFRKLPNGLFFKTEKITGLAPPHPMGFEGITFTNQL